MTSTSSAATPISILKKWTSLIKAFISRENERLKIIVTRTSVGRKKLHIEPKTSLNLVLSVMHIWSLAGKKLCL